jgi:1-acyl-sn-glycerol-3-phosphate acyltransferase
VLRSFLRSFVVQNIIIDKPYQFVPPIDSWFWPSALDMIMARNLKRLHGVHSVECVGTEHLRRSLSEGHGILLAPNHSRPCDPMVLSMLSQQVGRHFFIMASWHLFMQNRLQTFLLQRSGAFSIYREGMDKSALNAGIDILVEAKRPLVLFPEGVISRTNDHLNPLMEGTSFIARNAAKKRQKTASLAKVVVHPVAINYFFHGDIDAAVTPVLEHIESRLSWRPRRGNHVIERITKIGEALLSLKELEYLGQPRSGELGPRLTHLIEQILAPLETEYRNGQREANVIARVKRLRQSILPDLTTNDVTELERDRRWRQLADLYLAQQLEFYPHEYIRSRPTPERILETVERFEEDLTDKARVHRPIHAVVQVGEGIDVSPERERGSADPVMQRLEEQLKGMLEKTSQERTKVLQL